MQHGTFAVVAGRQMSEELEIVVIIELIRHGKFVAPSEMKCHEDVKPILSLGQSTPLSGFTYMYLHKHSQNIRIVRLIPLQ